MACPGLTIAPATTGTNWVCEAENVRDFSVVVNPNFGLTTQTIGQTTIRVYTQTGAGAVTADKAAAALAGLNQAYGTYPWPDLVLAEVGAYDGFSMEYPRAIHLTRSKVTDSYVINHEVAHQWFYAQLGNHQMLEPWLDEAFADFSARYLMGIGVNHCSSRDVDSSVFAWEAGLTAGGDWQSCDGYFHAVFKGDRIPQRDRRSNGQRRFLRRPARFPGCSPVRHDNDPSAARPPRGLECGGLAANLPRVSCCVRCGFEPDASSRPAITTRRG